MELTGTLFSLGMLLFLLGFLLTVVGTIWGVTNKPPEKEKRGRVGGLIMIGPIPIVFGSDKQTSRLLLAIAIGFIVLFLLLFVVPLFLV